MTRAEARADAAAAPAQGPQVPQATLCLASKSCNRTPPHTPQGEIPTSSRRARPTAAIEALTMPSDKRTPNWDLSAICNEPKQSAPFSMRLLLE